MQSVSVYFYLFLVYGEDYEGGEAEGEIEQQCTCDPCTCETPGKL